ncbi:unnamed protein product [Tuber melanosporum]|uniref:(Perigord truffle) hypothetical protein n=1 Tax=Tuber melanosporum (strain Mel28) TaxID=656061 RepID=D5G807_TUBMM|nr:uncharacterized protein GSTUM_00002774001 [Tuber melanosporum]CAZ80650.1 unnamed protein product [Tuber melanosporum]
MSYSVISQTTSYRRRSSIASSTSTNASYPPPELQLLNSEAPYLPPSPESRPVQTEYSPTDRVMSMLKSSVLSGTSYEMVGDSSDEEGDLRSGRGAQGSDATGDNRRTNGRRDSGDMDREADEAFSGMGGEGIVGSRVSVSDPPHSKSDSASQGATSSVSYGDHRTELEIAERDLRLELHLDGRADISSPQRGDVSDPQTARGVHRPYQHHIPSGSRSSHQLPPLPVSAGILDPEDQAFGFTASPEDVHPAFRPSQSYPELPLPPKADHAREQREYRPATSATNIGDLFEDFDGVHFDLDHPNNRFSVAPPPPPHRHRQRQSQHSIHPTSPHSDSQGSSNLVFYPAPVPAMLNLPPTLSKPKSTANNRHSRHIPDNADPTDNRRSVAYSVAGAPGHVPDKDLHRRSVATLDQAANRRSIANLPPALRASQFFDIPTIPQIEVKEDSAVATLDSILDASAKAPPAAFTDHPIAGGAVPYGPKGNRSSMHLPSGPNNNYRNSVAITVKLHPGESPRSSMEDEIHEDARSHLNPETSEYYDPGNQHRHSGISEDFAPQPDPDLGGGLPTTLLAELESRKAQQRLRNRTAASAFPGGIRSTLLQLDAVAQVQKEARSRKKTHLAWEDPGDVDEDDDQDGDVPLGLLYTVAPGAQTRRDDEVPLGLLMKKQMEDAEPLSKRRERLQGQNGHVVQPQPRRFLDLPGLGGGSQTSAADAEEEVEGETLKDRMKRLKERKEFGTGTLGMEFTSPSEGNGSTAKQEPAPPATEETLAQRRRRLQQQEATKHESSLLQQEVRNRRNMMDLLYRANNRPQSYYSQAGNNAGYIQPQPQMGGLMGNQYNMQMGRGMPMPMQMQMPMPMNMGGTGEAILDPKQREVVERWRASVM